MEVNALYPESEKKIEIQNDKALTYSGSAEDEVLYILLKDTVAGQLVGAVIF